RSPSSSRLATCGTGAGAVVIGPVGARPPGASRPYRLRLGSGAKPGSGKEGSGPREARATKGMGDVVTYRATAAATTRPSSSPAMAPNTVPPDWRPPRALKCAFLLMSFRRRALALEPLRRAHAQQGQPVGQHL